ncbi:unnamed protein product [Rotaria sp. Silwood2]|nr:unnamed protein product [Rotaria sp. Silwood2]CAF2785656.1 unnamed protein product [Rotaria sp. Silwood2]CAF3107069.1 unnamed protein product [Rotaria sp. Silwood2]CAF4198792.1 unnamed protein product [Rotaria sp. Silwood2]CAF4244899.1 unnamed protein product [Rotaria sp. Silwood2]
MKHRAARRRTYPQIRETTTVMMSKSQPHHKINRSYRPTSLQEQTIEKQQKRFDTVNQILEKVSSKPMNTTLNQNNSNSSTQNGDDDGSEVSIVGYLKAKPIKFQTLDDLLKNFPSVRAALFKKRTTTPAPTSTETITSHLSFLQLTPQSTISRIPSTKSAWRTRRTYALTEDELALVQTILVGDENESFGSIGDQPITRKDIRTLRGLTWLNDEVVNFYLALVARESGTPGNLHVYAFSTFFYSKLSKDGPTHTSWDRWMRRGNVAFFDYDLILIPIHQGNHWILTTIDFRSRCIGYYDSLGGTDDMCLGRIYAFVEHMYATKRQITPMPDGWRVQPMNMIPEQANGSDCGVFACQFGKYLAREWPLDFTQAQMAQFRLQMIYEIYTKQLIV